MDTLLMEKKVLILDVLNIALYVVKLAISFLNGELSNIGIGLGQQKKNG